MTYSFCYALSASNHSFVYVSGSVTEVLGFEVEEIQAFTIDQLLDEDETEQALDTMRAVTQQSKAACLVYLQFLHRAGRYVDCVMAQSAVNNFIVGSISLAPTGPVAATLNQSAEEVIEITEIDVPEHVPRLNWVFTAQPRTFLLLDRFSGSCAITYCMNDGILNSNTCVGQPGGIFRYIVRGDEQLVRNFISGLKRTGIAAGTGSFSYLNFTMCTTGRDLRATHQDGSPPRDDEVPVSVIGSATSDSIILIIRQNN